MAVRGEPMSMKLMKQNKGWRTLGRLFASEISYRHRYYTYLYYLYSVCVCVCVHVHVCVCVCTRLPTHSDPLYIISSVWVGVRV